MDEEIEAERLVACPRSYGQQVVVPGFKPRHMAPSLANTDCLPCAERGPTKACLGKSTDRYVARCSAQRVGPRIPADSFASEMYFLHNVIYPGHPEIL